MATAPHVNTMARTPLSAVGEIVRKHDPDRFLTALFAPPEHRETLFTLYAFNHELARAREAVREPFAALIRLQWWREVVEGARRRHEVAGPVGEALDGGRLLESDLMGLVNAREAEAGPIDTLDHFEGYVRGTAGGLMVAAGRALSVDRPEALQAQGAAYGVAGVLRSISALARQNRCVLPIDVLEHLGLSAAAVIAAPDCDALVPVRRQLAARAMAWLAVPHGINRSQRSAILPTVFARRDLARDGRGARTMLDKLAVLWAGV